MGCKDINFKSIFRYLYTVRFIKADKLFDGRTYLQEDAVLVLDAHHVLQEIVSETSLDANQIEKREGILTPGFVNAHCHLELSHLKGKITRHTGLPVFAQQIMSLRNGCSPEEQLEQMAKADKQMYDNGIVAVGDISNTAESFSVKKTSGIYYHTFIELIGLQPKNAGIVFEKGTALLQKLKNEGLSGSLAPHAPYSVSRELIKAAAEFDAHNFLPFSIHNQESDEETKFFEGKASGFNDLYRFLGMDISWFQAPGGSSLAHYIDLLSHNPAVLVHNTVTTNEDVLKASDKSIYWCFCPMANQYIEHRLPDFTLFHAYKNKVCLGTDSLASNEQLNLIAEANLILQHTPVFSEKDILQALTYNGAQALGISQNFGSWIRGKNAGVNQVQFYGSTLQFINKIA